MVGEKSMLARAGGVVAKRRRSAGRRAQGPGRPVSLLQIEADLGAAVRVDTVVREGTKLDVRACVAGREVQAAGRARGRAGGGQVSAHVVAAAPQLGGVVAVDRVGR